MGAERNQYGQILAHPFIHSLDFAVLLRKNRFPETCWECWKIRGTWKTSLPVAIQKTQGLMYSLSLLPPPSLFLPSFLLLHTHTHSSSRYSCLQCALYLNPGWQEFPVPERCHVLLYSIRLKLWVGALSIDGSLKVNWC